MTPDANSFN